MPRILILGAGFAGLWAAIGAARKIDQIGPVASEADVLVVDRNDYHNIRVRNYEVDLSDVAIPLADLLDPIGVKQPAVEQNPRRANLQQMGAAGDLPGPGCCRPRGLGQRLCSRAEPDPRGGGRNARGRVVCRGSAGR